MRYTAEYRGSYFPDEWCVVDEDVAPTGAAIAGAMGEEIARKIADALNAQEARHGRP